MCKYQVFSVTMFSDQKSYESPFTLLSTFTVRNVRSGRPCFRRVDDKKYI